MIRDDIFTQLLAFEWRSGEASRVLFPVTTMRISMQQELASHGVWGQDVEQHEATGRRSLTFTARIPFRNGIVPGKSERWGVLYPDAYRSFLVATANRASGTLVHPELGPVLCKVVSVESDWDATKRDGCDVDATWVETRRLDTDFELFADSPVTEATIAALSLDAEISGASIRGSLVSKGFLNSPKTEPTTDLLSFLEAVGDQGALFEQRTLGRVDTALGQLDRIYDIATRPGKLATQTVRDSTLRTKQLGDTVKRARDFVTDPNATAAAEACLAWPIRQQIAILRTSLYNIRQTIFATGKTVVFYTVQKACTLASLVASTGARLTDLVKLNPGLVRRAIVPAGIIVRYYASADV